jgi:hypothetical protein
MGFRVPFSNQHAVMLLLMITTFAVIEFNHMQASLQPPIAKATTMEGVLLIQRSVARMEKATLQRSLRGSTVYQKDSTWSLRGAIGWMMETNKTTATEGTKQDPDRILVHEERTGAGKNMGRILIQLVFGLLYYFCVITKYPKLNGSVIPDSAKELQNKNEVSAVCEATCSNNCLSCCCSGPRAAHTFHATGILDYWPGCVLMSLLPCCTLWIVNSCTELNEKLGGKQDSCCKAGLCSCFCSCCMIAKDAQTLDLITGFETGILSVRNPEGTSNDGPIVT